MPNWRPSRICCCSLRTASYVVGLLALIGGVLDLINACAGSFAFVIQWLVKLKLVSCLEEYNEQCDDQVNSYVIGFCIALLVAESVQVLFSSMLLYGIFKDRPGLMVPYMVWTVVRLAMYLIWVMVCLVVYISMPMVLLMLLAALITLSIVDCFYLLVIRTQYSKMKQDLSISHVMLEEESENL